VSGREWLRVKNKEGNERERRDRKRKQSNIKRELK
jgi:hypothetical protein